MLVSVYIPTKNRVTRLKRAVDSVLSQTYRPIELLITDDGSTDGTREYLYALAKLDPRVTIITHENSRGAPASRNHAIQQSSGHFLTGLDDDDTFEPCRIDAFVNYWSLLERTGHRPSCLYSQDIFSLQNGTTTTTAKTGSATVAGLLAGNFIGNQIFSTRNNFIEAGLFDESLPAWQDFEFFIRFLDRFGNANLLDLPTYRFDATDRPDRISADERRIRAAYHLVTTKHFSQAPRSQQQLMLHVFAPYYGFRPSRADFVTFVRLGFWPRGILSLLQSIFLNKK